VLPFICGNLEFFGVASIHSRLEDTDMLSMLYCQISADDWNRTRDTLNVKLVH
jgi:hypothetical protein